MSDWVLVLYLAASPVMQHIPMNSLSECEAVREKLVVRTERTHKVRGSLCIKRDDLTVLISRR
jgi:hypothetical protein